MSRHKYQKLLLWDLTNIVTTNKQLGLYTRESHFYIFKGENAMEEVIYPRFNGFLFDDFNGAIDSINKIKEISRKDCKRTANQCKYCC